MDQNRKWGPNTIRDCNRGRTRKDRQTNCKNKTTRQWKQTEEIDKQKGQGQLSKILLSKHNHNNHRDKEGDERRNKF